ncbi:TPA: tail fiber assembly protein, partial [Escherichia coli]|nr:tail fiber assembly protein [Escherichia coli]
MTHIFRLIQVCQQTVPIKYRVLLNRVDTSTAQDIE